MTHRDMGYYLLGLTVGIVLASVLASGRTAAPPLVLVVRRDQGEGGESG